MTDAFGKKLWGLVALLKFHQMERLKKLTFAENNAQMTVQKTCGSATLRASASKNRAEMIVFQVHLF